MVYFKINRCYLFDIFIKKRKVGGGGAKIQVNLSLKNFFYSQ